MNRVFFSPYSAIWKHSEIEISYLLENKTNSGVDYFISCDRDLGNYCNSMAAFGVFENATTEEKDEICQRCLATDSFKRRILPSNFLSIKDLTDPIDDLEIERFVSGVNRENWKITYFRGVNVGIIATYEIFLRHKISESQISTDLWQIYLRQLEYCCKVVVIANRVFSTMNVSSLVLYNDLYSLNKTFAQVALEYQVEVISVQASGPPGDEHSRFTVDNLDSRTLQLFDSSHWEASSKSPLGIREVYEVHKHLKGLLKAKSFWVYSERTIPSYRRSIFKDSLGVPKSSCMVLVPLSSQDEWFAERFTAGTQDQGQLFNQIDLIEEITKFAVENPDWFFVVRPHPREYPNKRESSTSQHGESLRNYFEKKLLPPNVILNDPEDKVSLYHLMISADFVFNTLSSVGAEAGALGIPVLSIHTEQFSAYPRELNHYMNKDYLFNFDASKFLSSHQLNLSIRSYRWFSFRYYKSTKGKFGVIPKIVFKVLNILRALYVRSNMHLFPSLAVKIFRLTILIRKMFFKLNSPIHKFEASQDLILSFSKITLRYRLFLEKVLIATSRFVIKKSIFLIND
jgi:hypothetical protein